MAPRHHPSSLEQRIQVSQTLFGNKLVFSNPVGLAAGFDKDGEVMQQMLDLGFGFVEIGTVTPQPQPGTLTRPRMFRLPEDQAIINRYGFNSIGSAQVALNLLAYRQQQTEYAQQEIASASTATNPYLGWIPHIGRELLNAIHPPVKHATGIVGVNIGKNANTLDTIADYVHGISTLGPHADYLVINISSPNTVGLRDYQDPAHLKGLLTACLQARDKLENKPPLLIKFAPELTEESIYNIAGLLLDLSIDGLIVSNTTLQRPDDLISQHRTAMGGLSGKPLKESSTRAIRTWYAATRGMIPIIGVGGIGSGQDVYDKLKAGASCVQIYSMMVYQGPGLVSRIRNELAEIMLQNGQRSLEEVIGMDHVDLYWERQTDVRVRKYKTHGTALARQLSQR
jgi:dihydroorotate dehydrogenase